MLLSKIARILASFIIAAFTGGLVFFGLLYLLFSIGWTDFQLSNNLFIIDGIVSVTLAVIFYLKLNSYLNEKSNKLLLVLEFAFIVGIILFIYFSLYDGRGKFSMPLQNNESNKEPPPPPPVKPNSIDGGGGGYDKLHTFPWPPPKASSKEVIPRKLLAQDASKPTFKDIDTKISEALRKIGHSEYSYFWIPAGYALVTRIEKFQKNGKPKPGVERWEDKLYGWNDVSLGQYLQGLFFAKQGFYRLIVFVISPKEWRENEDTITEEEAIMWLRLGYDRLPNELSSVQFSESYVCTALIYEFEQTSPKKYPHLLSPGKLAAHTHLEASGFYKALGE